MADIFNVGIFFVILRETLEAVIIISTLLAFVNQSLGARSKKIRKKLNIQIWTGALAGVFVCLVIGGAFIGVYYKLKKDIWSKSEDLWEGIFCIIATVMITIMGISMLRINKMQAKWRVKIAQSLAKKPSKRSERFKCGYLMERYSMFLLPFVTTLREGMEAVVFVGGVGIGASAKSIPLPVVVGLIVGIIVGLFMYYGGSKVSLQIFLCVSTALLYLVSAGLFSRGVWFFENYKYTRATGGDAAENGSGPGTYDITKSVWHVNCCNPLKNSGWSVFNSLLGWQNSATYGSVLSYNLYWLAIIVTLAIMYYQEKYGHLPFCKLTLKQLNPMYYLKKSKRKKLSEDEERSLYANAQRRIQEEADAAERDEGGERAERESSHPILSRA